MSRHLRGLGAALLGLVSFPAIAVADDLDIRIDHEQKYVLGCADAVKSDTDAIDPNKWEFLYFKRENIVRSRDYVVKKLRALRDEDHAITADQAKAEYQEALALTRQEIKNCIDNAAKVQAQLDKDLVERKERDRLTTWATAQLSWDGAGTIEVEGELKGGFPSWRYDATKFRAKAPMADGSPSNFKLWCTGHVERTPPSSGRPLVGAPGMMECTATWGTLENRWHCVGDGVARTYVDNQASFFGLGSCSGEVVSDGKSETRKFGHILIRNNDLGGCCDPP